MQPQISLMIFQKLKKRGFIPHLLAERLTVVKRENFNTRHPKVGAGFTIIELLVVLSILAIMAGVLSSFMASSNKQFSFQAMQGAIVSLLRYARSEAITQKNPSLIEVNFSERRIYCYVSKNIRLWHMEDLVDGKTSGAFGYDGTCSVGDGLDLIRIPEGRYGRGLWFRGAVEIDCGKLKLMGNERLLEISAWIYPSDGGTTNQTIMKLKDNYYFILTGERGLLGRFGFMQASSMPEIVPRDSWSYVKLVYEADSAGLNRSQNTSLTLYLNNDLVAQVTGANNLEDFESIFISEKGQSFFGKIDEVKIAAMMETERLQLEPPTITINSDITPVDNKIKLLFNDKGELVNASTAQLIFSNPQSRESFTITIDAFGMVEAK